MSNSSMLFRQTRRMRLFFKRLGQLFEVVYTQLTAGDVDAVLLRQSDDQPLGRPARDRELIG
jgi:hypothetical protein